MPITVVDLLLEGDCLPPLNIRKRMEHTGNMDSNPFRFNSEAKYQPGPQKAPRSGTHDVGNLAEGRIQVQSDDPQKWFGAKYSDIFEHYLLPPVSSDKLVQTWRSNPMQFWQNQFNFAVWCATTGCGVSLEDHLSAADGLLQSVYRFHVYYQIRRILVEIQTPLPQDQAWDAVNNPYDRRGTRESATNSASPNTLIGRSVAPTKGLVESTTKAPTSVTTHSLTGSMTRATCRLHRGQQAAFSTWTSSSRMPPEQAEPGKRSHLTSQMALPTPGSRG